MAQEGFDFYAFISYSHKDQDTAKKLQGKLEHYHLPSALLKSHPGLPKKLSPIFMDESDLVAVGPLQTTLREYLDSAKYLILICSPNSAQSTYVNDEVQYFIDQGKIGRIVPLIIAGEPNSEDPEQECFPPAIRNLPKDLEPLGIDVQKFGERDAFVRVIATLLELKLEVLKSRIIIEMRKKIALYSSLAAVFAIIAGFLVWYNIPHYKYFHTYVYRHEKPVGLFEVKSEADRKKIEYTYKFTIIRGKVQMIERVNSAGTLVTPSIITPLMELPMICFLSDGSVEYYDLYRRKVYKKRYSQNMQAVDFYCGDADMSYALPSDTYAYYDEDKYHAESSASQSRGSIRRITLEYDDNGYVVKKRFRRDNYGGKDRKGSLAQDEKGRWGFSYTLDDMGRVIAIHYLDKNGEPIAIQGIYAEFSEYGDAPYSLRDTYVDKDGKPVLDSDGVAIKTAVYDKYFNIEKWSCLDANGNPVMNAQHNVSSAVFTHDPETGFLTSMSHYDTNMQPCINNEGLFRVEVAYNKEGRRIKVSDYDVRGKKIITTYGYAGIDFTYNDDGQISSVKFYDTEGNPAIDSDSNTYGMRYSYEDGFTKRIDYLDAEGSPMLSKYGYASAVYSYNKDENKLTGFVYKDTYDRNILTSWGYAQIRYSYDENGNKSEETYHDEEGRLITANEGVAKYEYGWKDGSQVSLRCYDANGKPVMNSYGYARREREYDDSGLKIWERYYGSDGRRVMIPDGYSAVSYSYDDRGNKTSQIYYDAGDNYAKQADEHFCYAKKYEYYDNGTTKSIQYIREQDSQYQNMLDRLVEYVCYEYDAHRRETKRYWLNGRGEEVDSKGRPLGYIRIEHEYDANGRKTRDVWLGRNEERSKITQEYEYDSFGRRIATHGIRYIAGRKDVLSECKAYDDYGNCYAVFYKDGDQALIMPSKKIKGAYDYSIKFIKHDIFGHETDIWYYDEYEQPLSKDNRAFHTVRTYDSKGNILTESYYDDEGEENPVELSGGFHRMVRSYDAFGHETERWLYDKDGELIRRDDTGCRIVKKYNTLGQLVSIEAYDADGKPALEMESRAFKTVQEYDSFGKVCDYWYFDGNGSPCRRVYQGTVAWHHSKRSYDAMGNLLSNELFDEDGKPCLYDGVHKLTYTYNVYGLKTEEAQYDEKQKLLRKMVFSYDSDGNRTGKKWVTKLLPES